MTWFNKPWRGTSAPLPTVPQHRLHVPVTIQLRKVAEPVQAMVLHLAVDACRLRCSMALERGTAVAFDWTLDGGGVLRLAGVVVARYNARNGGVGFEYAIALEALPSSDSDALTREAALLTRRSAAARNYDTCIVDVSQFTGYRVPDDFPIAFRFDDGRGISSTGSACDVIGSGLRVRCERLFQPGEIVLLQFTLPDRKHVRRGFPALELKAKVLGTVKDSRRRDAYELQFVDVDSTMRDELARYISASQLQGGRR